MVQARNHQEDKMSQELIAKYKALKAQRSEELAAYNMPISSWHWLDAQIADIENTLFGETAEGAGAHHGNAN